MELNAIQAMILGLVQGLGEFLPISSSGHLILMREVFRYPEPGKIFDVMLHGGTLISLMVFFWKDIVSILKAALEDIKKGRFYGEKNINLIWFLIISTIPAGIAGILFNDYLESIRSIYFISALLIFFGFLLLMADRRGDKSRILDGLTWKDALIVGLLQALALFPGVSRSGICMTGALLLGFNRETSARYSFLISIPLIAGTSVYGLMKLLKSPPDNGGMMIYGIGMLTACVSGFLCIKFLLDYLKKGTFLGFTIYRAVLGILLIIMGIMGIVK